MFFGMARSGLHGSIFYAVRSVKLVLFDLRCFFESFDFSSILPT